MLAIFGGNDRLIRLEVLPNTLVDRLLAKFMQILRSLDFDHVFHRDLISPPLVLLVCLVNVNACIPLLSFQRCFIVWILIRHILAHNDVHTVILQRIAVPQVAFTDAVLALLRLCRSTSVLLLLHVRLRQYVYILMCRWQLSRFLHA